jgi:glucokinase
LILEGRVSRGRNRRAGAAGGFALTSDAEGADPRGQSIGHWESLAAGPGIARRAFELLPTYPSSRLHAIPEERLTARLVFEAARQDDALAAQVVDETARLIGLGAANVISLVNPEIVVLGGSVGRQPELLPGIKSVVARWAQPVSASSVRIVVSELGADAGVYGAAYAALTRAQADATGAHHPIYERS